MWDYDNGMCEGQLLVELVQRQCAGSVQWERPEVPEFITAMLRTSFTHLKCKERHLISLTCTEQNKLLTYRGCGAPQSVGVGKLCLTEVYA